MTTQSFWDRIAPNYARKPVADPGAYAEKLTLVASLLRAQDHVLEIGCGTGTTALHLAPGVAHYTGTDGARAMVGIAKAKLGANAPEKVTFLQADAAEQVPGGPYDAICAFSLLHLVEDVPSVLVAVHTQLKPGGLFLSKTVCVGAAYSQFAPGAITAECITCPGSGVRPLRRWRATQADGASVPWGN